MKLDENKCWDMIENNERNLHCSDVVATYAEQGTLPQYSLNVEIFGNISICGQQTETELTVEATGGTEPYEFLWNSGETTETIHIEVSQGGGETYSVTVTDYNGCSQDASVQLTRYDSEDSDGDGYCDEIDCAPYSAELGGPGSPCDDGNPNTINDVHDADCNCAGIPNPCEGDDTDGDGLCDCEPGGIPNPNGLPQGPICEDCNDSEANIGGIGSPCDDGDPNTINDRMNAECICVGELKEKKYQFVVEGKYYFEMNTVFVCAKSLPINVSVVSSEASHTPVTETCLWKINDVLKTETSSTLPLDLVDFNNKGLSKLYCEFMETGTNKKIILKINVNIDIQLKFTENLKKYQYDDNKIQPYINEVKYGEKLGTPWNFVASGLSDDLFANVSKSSAFYAVKNISSNNTNLNINPTFLSKNKENINFKHNGAGKEIIDVRGCSRTDPELLIYTETPKTFIVELYRVCETDDDLQVKPVGTIVSSADEVCIDGGIDKSIDLMRNPDFIPKGTDGKFLDDLVFSFLLNRWQILAGNNLRCDTEAHSNNNKPPECPGTINESDFLQEANQILGKIALSAVPKEVNITTLYANFDTYNDDGVLDNELEYYDFYNLRQSIESTLNDGLLEIHFFEDLGEYYENNQLYKRKGRTFNDYGSNIFALDRIDSDGSVLVHEAGHAKWRLIHPHLPPLNVIGDYNNFMQGEGIRTGTTIRRYQFDNMHKF